MVMPYCEVTNSKLVLYVATQLTFRHVACCLPNQSFQVCSAGRSEFPCSVVACSESDLLVLACGCPAVEVSGLQCALEAVFTLR